MPFVSVTITYLVISSALASVLSHLSLAPASQLLLQPPLTVFILFPLAVTISHLDHNWLIQPSGLPRSGVTWGRLLDLDSLSPNSCLSILFFKNWMPGGCPGLQLRRVPAPYLSVGY